MIDLSHADEITSEADSMIRRLHGIHLNDADGQIVSRTDAARLTRDLLYLADRLNMASQLVREQYWSSKGYMPGAED